MSAWDELLRAPGADDVVADVLRAVVDAAAKVTVDELEDAKKLVPLDPARKQSATSTVSVVRSFQWAAQVLGVEAPELYVMDSVPGGIARRAGGRAVDGARAATCCAGWGPRTSRSSRGAT